MLSVSAARNGYCAGGHDRLLFPKPPKLLHTQEQYRLQTIYDDVNVERERQIRSFTDWENQFIYNIATGMPFGEMVFLANSDFGMWFSHKGKHILGNSNLLKEMESLIARSTPV